MNQLFLIDIPKGSLPLETQWSRTKELTSIHILVKLPYNLGVERTSRDNSFSFCRHQFYTACTYFSATWSTFATAENMSSTLGSFCNRLYARFYVPPSYNNILPNAGSLIYEFTTFIIYYTFLGFNLS